MYLDIICKDSVRFTPCSSLGKPEKIFFSRGPATKRGGGAKGLATKKKELLKKIPKKYSQKTVATKKIT